MRDRTEGAVYAHQPVAPLGRAQPVAFLAQAPFGSRVR